MSEHVQILSKVWVAMIATAVLAGCAPPAHMRPMTPFLPGQRGELGAAWAAVGPRPIGPQEWEHGSQAWGSFQPTPRFDMSVVGVFADGVTAGLAFRWRAIESAWATAGVGAELGIGWMSFNLPVALLHGALRFIDTRLGLAGLRCGIAHQKHFHVKTLSRCVRRRS